MAPARSRPSARLGVARSARGRPHAGGDGVQAARALRDGGGGHARLSGAQERCGHHGDARHRGAFRELPRARRSRSSAAAPPSRPAPAGTRSATSSAYRSIMSRRPTATPGGRSASSATASGPPIRRTSCRTRWSASAMTRWSTGRAWASSASTSPIRSSSRSARGSVGADRSGSGVVHRRVAVARPPVSLSAGVRAERHAAGARAPSRPWRAPRRSEVGRGSLHEGSDERRERDHHAEDDCEQPDRRQRRRTRGLRPRRPRARLRCRG